MNNFNEYYQGLGSTTPKIDSTNDDWADYFSTSVDHNQTYRDIEEIQQANAIHQNPNMTTYMDAVPVVVRQTQPVQNISEFIPQEFSANTIENAQMRMVAMQEEWNAMHNEFNEALNKTKPVCDEKSDEIAPGIHFVNKDDKKEDNIVNEDVKIVDDITPVAEDNKEADVLGASVSQTIDTTNMSNEELIADLGFEFDFGETKTDDDKVEIKPIEEEKPKEVVEETKVEKKKAPVKTNKSAVAKTTKTTTKKVATKKTTKK